MVESRKNYRDSRQEFERHLNLLGESLKSGKMSIAPELRSSVGGIIKVRSAPNKRINLNTVDESVRNMAMMAARNFKEDHD